MTVSQPAASLHSPSNPPATGDTISANSPARLCGWVSSPSQGGEAGSEGTVRSRAGGGSPSQVALGRVVGFAVAGVGSCGRLRRHMGWVSVVGCFEPTKHRFREHISDGAISRSGTDQSPMGDRPSAFPTLSSPLELPPLRAIEELLSHLGGSSQRPRTRSNPSDGDVVPVLQ